MTWTYDPEDLTSELAKVRWLSGDTDAADQLVTDEEIAFALELEGTVYGAAARLCESLAARFAREADQKEIGDLKLRYSKRGGEFAALATRLRASATRGGGTSVYAGGISIADKNMEAGRTDRVPPKFSKDLHSSQRSDVSGYLTKQGP